MLLGTTGILRFIPGATSFTLREAGIVVAAAGLVMMVVGPVIRLPLRSWANYAAYTGRAIGFVVAVRFVVVFPNDRVVATGSQPVIVLYALGLAVITIGGAFAPLLSESDDDAAARAVAATERDAEDADRAAETGALRSEGGDLPRATDSPTTSTTRGRRPRPP